MKKLDDGATLIDTGRNKLVKEATSRAFDVIALCLILAMTAYALGVFDHREFTWSSMLEIFINTVPFFLASQLLNINYYTKGTTTAKKSDRYIAISAEYSSRVADLTGEQVEKLDEFCLEYNEQCLKQIRIAELKRYGISYEEFMYGDDALIYKTRKQLLEKYPSSVVNTIEKAKNARVCGISSSKLLSNMVVDDPTYLGQTEGTLRRTRMSVYSICSWFFTFLFSIIAVKNILEWGWTGIVIVLFKLLFSFAFAYMKYFDGYKDVAEKVSIQIARKSDHLKSFSHWFNERYHKGNFSVEK